MFEGSRDALTFFSLAEAALFESLRDRGEKLKVLALVVKLDRGSFAGQVAVRLAWGSNECVQVYGCVLTR